MGLGRREGGGEKSGLASIAKLLGGGSNQTRQSQASSGSQGTAKKCIHRQGRCLIHRVKLEEKIKKERILDRDELGKMCYRYVEIKTWVCNHEERRKSVTDSSRGQGEVGRGKPVEGACAKSVL